MVFWLRKNQVARRGFDWKSAWCACLILLAFSRPNGLAGESDPAPAGVVDLAKPSLMTGTLYRIGSDRKEVIFQFRRSAVRQGENVLVEQSFSLPDGSVACRETIHYRNNRIVSYEMGDLRTGARGTILIERDPKKSGRERMLLEHVKSAGAKLETSVETLQPNTLISDTIYPFILTHWDELMQGLAVKFRLISLDPLDTYGFRVVKDSTTTWSGKPVVRIKMEPTNLIIAHLVHPIYFLIETAAPHRVFSYTGRTTPKENVGGTWKFVEAEAVFDWP